VTSSCVACTEMLAYTLCFRFKYYPYGIDRLSRPRVRLDCARFRGDWARARAEEFDDLVDFTSLRRRRRIRRRLRRVHRRHAQVRRRTVTDIALAARPQARGSSSDSFVGSRQQEADTMSESLQLAWIQNHRRPAVLRPASLPMDQDRANRRSRSAVGGNRVDARGAAVLRKTAGVPPRGFEPLISTLKGWRPRPLDDGGTRGRLVPSIAEGARASPGAQRWGLASGASRRDRLA
jgi:hypothetical protein